MRVTGICRMILSDPTLYQLSYMPCDMTGFEPVTGGSICKLRHRKPKWWNKRCERFKIAEVTRNYANQNYVMVTNDCTDFSPNEERAIYDTSKTKIQC